MDEIEWQDTKDALRTRIGMAAYLLGLGWIARRLMVPSWVKTVLDDWQWELKYGDQRRRSIEHFERTGIYMEDPP